MARINVLPKEIYQLIAAGEVVERKILLLKSKTAAQHISELLMTDAELSVMM